MSARHALEADDAAAVATLVENRERPLLPGTAWGVGQPLSILLVGTLFLVLDLRISVGIATGFEVIVAVVLVVVGLRLPTWR